MISRTQTRPLSPTLSPMPLYVYRVVLVEEDFWCIANGREMVRLVVIDRRRIKRLPDGPYRVLGIGPAVTEEDECHAQEL